jgi:hypothetical protein
MLCKSGSLLQWRVIILVKKLVQGSQLSRRMSMSRFLLGLRGRILIFSWKKVVCSPGVEGGRHFVAKKGKGGNFERRIFEWTSGL